LLADGSTHPDKGKVVFLDRAVDVRTGTLRARMQFPNTARVLRPGMFARVRVDIGARPDSVLVSERAVSELQGKNFVWVVGSDNKTSQRSVQVGQQFGEKLLILEGLKPGERIVVEGLQKIREGAPVQPMTAVQLAQAAPSQLKTSR
jgi:membrane fusion protein (multidrug efflux system)